MAEEQLPIPKIGSKGLQFPLCLHGLDTFPTPLCSASWFLYHNSWKFVKTEELKSAWTGSHIVVSGLDSQKYYELKPLLNTGLPGSLYLSVFILT